MITMRIYRVEKRVRSAETGMWTSWFPYEVGDRRGYLAQAPATQAMNRAKHWPSNKGPNAELRVVEGIVDAWVPVR